MPFELMDEIVMTIRPGSQHPEQDVVAFLRRAVERLAEWESNPARLSTLHPAWFLLHRRMTIEALVQSAPDSDVKWKLIEKARLDDGVPPEYLESGVWDLRSAIYSLGFIAWVLLSGRYPFQCGESVLETMTSRLRYPMENIVTFRKDIHPMLSEVIDRMVKLDPSLRFQSVGELRAALSA